MIYFCCDERRREAVRDHPTLNGIDYLEVLDHEAPEGSPRQRTLLVRLLKPEPMPTVAQVVIEGGERIRPVRVEWVGAADAVPEELTSGDERVFLNGLAAANQVLVVRTDSSGDHSPYTLRVVSAEGSLVPPEDFDPVLSHVTFSFKVECPSEFDCKPERICPETPRPEPEINYLAKDYASFRRTLLDRMALLAPEWRERSPADLGVTLVELLAYVGDYLSYEQDAIATEAYLGTARRRVSVRRHARLMDYRVHDGSNARAWVEVRVRDDVENVTLPERTPILTRVAGFDSVIDPTSLEEALRQNPVVFETMASVTVHSSLNRLRFYTWGDSACCLPKGATRATLDGHVPDLVGRVLLFEEVLGPRSGVQADSDPRKRQAVRIVNANAGTEEEPLTDPLTEDEITEIQWHPEDALTFPLCLSSLAFDEDRNPTVPIANVSVARGNIVLADHGRTITGENLGVVPRGQLRVVPATASDPCRPERIAFIPPRFRPSLQEVPLTQAAPYPFTDNEGHVLLNVSARQAMRWPLETVAPQIISLQGTLDGQTEPWSPRRDLLNSHESDPDCVAEVEQDGTVSLRFGNDDHGKRPNERTSFEVDYRIGNGLAGNVGAESLTHIVTAVSGIVSVSNPLPAQGGLEPESIEQVRQRAPYAFRTQERAVTPEDYAEVTMRHPDVQRAAATFRWTGSWYTVFVTVDRFGGLPVDEKFEQAIRGHLEKYRMAGYDLEVDGPHYVSLEIHVHVCVKRDYFRSDVKEALLELFSNRVLPDGRRGVFHPDHFSFGQTVYVSDIYAAAMAVPGVDSVVVERFMRQGSKDRHPLLLGKLELGRLEIARLDNDSNFPEHGVLEIQTQGGK